MLRITCDECGKRYQIDETKMKGTRAKVKCKACSKIMVVTKPRAQTSTEPSRSIKINYESVIADIPEPPPPRIIPIPW